MYIGGLYFTRGVQTLIDNKEIDNQEIWNCVARHVNLDYGDTDPHDVGINERNLNHNCGTVHSSYMINGIRVWVITSLGDVDTTYTTVLLPIEY